MRTVAVLPVKSFGRAKQRLRPAGVDRAELAAAMVGDVLEADSAGTLQVQADAPLDSLLGNDALRRLGAAA